MQALHLNEVIQRVVRWHNRHPLAHRISASQVHSIGEVVLPFSADRPWSAPGAALHTPPARPLAPDAPQEPLQPPGEAAAESPDADDISHPAVSAVEAAQVDIDPSAGTAAPPAMPSHEPADAAQIPDLADDEVVNQALLAAHEAALAAPPDQHPMPAPAPQSAKNAADAGSPATPSAPAAPGPRLAEVVERRAAARTAAVAAVPRGPRHWWARLRQALRGRPAGLPRLRAAFNRKVFWPSHPQTVASWAQRHAHAHPIAPEDWPHRVVAADPAQGTQLRRQGLVHGVELHALTAAIGVGDRRIRLLVGTDGSILGPRAYSRGRAASAGAALFIGMLGLGWGLRPPGAVAPAEGAALAAHAASAVSPPVAVVQAAASTAPAPAASHAAPATPLAHNAPPEPVEQAASAAAQTNATLPSATLTSADQPADAAQAASAPVARIRPSLSDEARQAAKAESDRLRDRPSPSIAPAPAAAAVFAVVSPPNRERRVAMNHLLIMRRAGSRLPPPAPDRGELMQNQGEWRAAWWPFASLADAERARVMLAGRGLRAEVVEF